MNDIQGLSEVEVIRRREAGQGNNVRFGASRSYLQILRENAFTFINTVLFAIGVLLLIMRRPDNALVTAGLVLLNVVVGVVQEGRAKQKLDRIALLTRPKATVMREGEEKAVDPAELVLGDTLVARPGDQLVVDGRVVGSGRMEVDESLLTGESDLQAKSAGDRIYSGSFCVTGSAAYEATGVGRDSYANKITAGARAFRRVKTPLQQDIDFIIRMMVTITGMLGVLLGLGAILQHLTTVQWLEVAAVIVALPPQGLFFMTTVTYATGAVRMAGRGALIQQANAIESLSNVDVLCLDKTGTLTTNRIVYRSLLPVGMTAEEACGALANYAASVSARNKTAEAITSALGGSARPLAAEVPFSSARKWSALAFAGGSRPGAYVLGAPEMLKPHLATGEGLDEQFEEWAGQGLRVLLFAGYAGQDGLHDDDGEPRLPFPLIPLALVSFSDELRPEAQDTLRQFTEAGISLKIISGDNPETVAALARQAGFEGAEAVSGLKLAEMGEDEFAGTSERANIFGRITPQQKENLVRALQERGHYVAMIGDGVNDVLSLKAAQLGIAMADGSAATRSVADIVLIENSFAALPAAFREGQRIVRGMQDVIRLFLTRTFYVTFLIMAAAMIGAPFPVSPKHNFILALLTVGVPALALAAWARPEAATRRPFGRHPHSTLHSVRHFVFAGALSVAVLALVVYVGAYVRARDATGAQTVLTTVTVLCGLLLVIFVEPPTPFWTGGDELSGDRRPMMLAGALLAVYAAILAVPALREFFEMKPLSWGEAGAVAALVIVWVFALRFIWRRRLIERFFELT